MPAVSLLVSLLDSFRDLLASNVNQLIKLLKTSCGDEGCCNEAVSFRDVHLKNLQETFEKYDEIATKIDGLKKQKDEKSKASVGTPSVSGREIKELEEQIQQNEEKLQKQNELVDQQITALKNALIELKNQIDDYIQNRNKEITELQRKIEAYKNEEQRKNPGKNISIPSHLSSQLATEQAKLKSHEASLESLKSLEKLMKFHEEVKKIPEGNKNCKDILDKLCTGLQTFLGYNSDSKGYDGTGIVYSDLDRLCDGVMSFLHGVLESVKNDDNVRTYYEMSPTCMENIEKQLNTGQHGLWKAVEAFKAWHMYYEKALNEKIGAVKTPLDGVKRQIEADKNKIEQEKDSAISDQINSWALRAQGYIDKVKEADKAREKLDPLLSGKININVSLLLQATNTFKEAAESRDLEELHRESFNVMQGVTDHVNEKFNAGVKRLQEYLKDKIGKLRDKLNKLQNEQFSRLQESVTSGLEPAFRKVEGEIRALVERYGEHVVGKLKNIVDFSNPFYTRFGATQRALKSAMNQVEADIGRLAQLNTFDHIMDGQSKIVAPLLQKIASKDAFAELSEYFILLESLVMDKVNDAMEGIGSWLEMLFQYGSGEYIHIALHDPKDSLHSLKTILENSSTIALEVPDELKDYLVDVEFKNPKPNVRGISNTIEEVLTKIGKRSSFKKGELITTIKSLLSDLAKIAAALSSHSKDVIEDVMDAIEKQVTKEIQGIAGAIFKQISMIHNGIKQSNESSVSITANGLKLDITGLEWLVTEFQDKINQELGTLQKSVGKDAADGQDCVYNDLMQLKKHIDTLGENMGIVKDNVLSVGTEVEACIRLSNDMLIKLPRWTEVLMDEVLRDISREITRGFQEVHAKAKTLYAQRKEREIQALQQIVTAQFRDVEKTIEEDKKNGVKGCLSKIKSLLVPQIQTMNGVLTASEDTIGHAHKQVKSQLTQAAEFLKKGFAEVLEFLTFQEETKEYDEDVNQVSTSLDTLLGQIISSHHFDDHVSSKLYDFTNSLTIFTPDIYKDAAKDVLTPIKKGFNAFAGEMEKAYVSYYSGRHIKWNSAGEAERNKYAEICVTIMRILYTDLSRLKEELEKSDTKWTTYNIYNHKNSSSSLYKLFFRDSGYDPSLPGNTAHGELNHKPVFTGTQIKGLLDHVLPGASQLNITIKNKQQSNVNVLDIIQYLIHHTDKYYDACHLRLPSSTKYPCSIRDILSWFSGLPHTAVYGKVFNHFHQLLKKDASYQNDPVLKPLLDLDLFTYLVYTCRKSHDVLAAIQGHGNGAPNADYPYASNFCDNSRSLYYPSDVSSLLDMLYDVVKRLCYALYFLYTKCINGASASNGWSGCAYGQAIPSPRWQCKGHPNTRPSDQPTDQPNCQPTSPLQGYLTDTLPGWLPHRLTSVGCSSKCATCTNASRGQQCITPMGFWDLYDAGSIVGSGKDICKLLADLCADADAVLFKLYRGLSLLSPSPPKTLGDMMSFFSHSLRTWASGRFMSNNDFIYEMNQKTIPNSFPLQLTLHGSPEASQLTDALRDLYYYKDGHNGKAAKDDTHCDLSSLVASSTLCLGRLCIPYLQPLSHDGNHTYALKHAGLYLSWALYLVFDFHELLKSLFDAFCSIDCKSSGCSSCNCLSGKHGVSEPKSEPKTQAIGKPNVQATSKPNIQPKSGCHCQSMVQCSGVQPTLFRYGFTFGNPEKLMNGSSRKTCDSFCDQLKKVIESDHFRKLFEVIDNFICAIRFPFMSLLLALWSLSLLYLLHITVVRLDVLRIRSHLRSPASHRIAAQSLLAAARVKALGNIKYFSP
ncbi:hypothetical protein, conserved [Babesia ovata]|uniref:Extracellular matrix-binding ebh n=1 Tax=Babesia ovata TaxID=189622 RepID=A0A2H6KK80_9APIC|nr:uncharacterized protein BOVATA_048840 [Babesia ovata]GBE63391.1 hypothetical protein, conserved [Babesia ovata]